MEKFIDYFAESYFTDLLCFFGTAFGAIYFLKNASKEFKIFIIYFIFFFITQIYYALAIVVSDTSFYPTFKKSQFSVDFTLTLLEVIVFYKFFYKVIPPIYKGILIVFAIVFFSVSIYFLLNDIIKFGWLKLDSLETIFIWESFILLIPCILYFNCMFKKLPPTPLIEDPYFWISSGVVFFVLSTLPFSFLMNYLRSSSVELYYSLYTIVNVFYILLFITIIKALSCRLKSIN